MSTTFQGVGKKVDERIADFKRKAHEVVEGFDESLKSADRVGYERALKAAADLATERGNPVMAFGIMNLPYAPPE